MQALTSIGRRERSKAAKLSRISAAATNRFTTQGYEATTVSQVAEDADVGVGTVFQYAATKAELLMLVLVGAWSGAEDCGRRNAEASHSPEDAVLALAAPMLDALLKWPGLALDIARELLFGAPGVHHDEAVALIERAEEHIGHELRRRGYQAGGSAARTLVSGIVLEIHRGQSGLEVPETLERRIRNLIFLVLNGSRTEPSAES